jgi:hypothetical protein
VLGDDRAADGRGDHHEEGGAAGGGQFLADHRQFEQAHATAAVLLGDVDADETGLGDGRPQFAHAAFRLGFLDVVVVAEVQADLADGVAEHPVFRGLVEIHAFSSGPLLAATQLPHAT